MKTIDRKNLPSKIPVSNFIISLLCNKVFELNPYLMGVWWFLIFIVTVVAIFHIIYDEEKDIFKS